MILFTGATGTLGRPLLTRLLNAGEDVRCFVREPRRLGPSRVQVQIALGDLAAPAGFDRAMRGVDTVVHLAVTTRDQQRGTIEEIDGIATLRLLTAAERAGARRFVHVSSFGASTISPSRFLRTQALAAEAVAASKLETLQFEAGLIYAPDDPWLGLIAELSHLPLMPVIGKGTAAFQPVWAEDAAEAIFQCLQRGIATPGAPVALVGPEELTQNQIVRRAMRHFGTQKPIVHIPAALARRVLRWQERRAGAGALATWDQVELLQRSSLSAHGPRDMQAVGVTPASMADVLPVR